MLTTPRIFAFTLLALSLACTKPATPPDTSAADRAAVDKGHDAFMAGLQSGDCNSLIPQATEDVVLDPPNMASAVGVQGFRGWCEPVFTQMKTKAVGVSDRDVVLAGDWAIEHGNFDWTVVPVAGGAEVRDQGKFVAIWRRQADGSWKLARDIWNSSLPVPAAVPAR